MGFITNQWLKGSAQRRRGHHPIQVEVEPVVSGDSWDLEHRVVAAMSAVQLDRTYQNVYFTEQDLAAVLPFLLSKAARSTQDQSAIIALVSMSDEELSSFLEELYSRRRAAKK